MANVSSKERLVKLMEIFEKQTNEENVLSIDDIILRLQEEFFKVYPDEYMVDRKTIKSDIKKLKETNFQIEDRLGKMGKKLYYFVGEDFERYEIRILLDAVYSAKFITNRERENLIRKIRELTNKNDKEIYDSKLLVPQLEVTENAALKYYLDKIHEAIFKEVKLEFQYGNYDTHKNFNVHHNGDYYIVHPYNLVWNRDFYYLVAYNEKRNTLINYRVDRMRNVNITEDKFKRDVDFNINKYLNNCFNMYPGKSSIIEIKFVNKLINAVIDRFGKGVNIINKDDSFFTIRIHAAVNEGLLRWILNWGSDAEVISPIYLRKMVKDEIEKMVNIYNRNISNS